jgi:CheY-like chemotaxis protein
LEDVRTGVSGLADKKRQTLELEVEDGLPPLVADQAKVKQIMYNLLSNAIKFTPEGGRVRMVARQPTLEQGEPGIPRIEVAVTDTGIGIRPEDQQRIFREFEQVDSAYGREQKGTGLGLALTRMLVELHGGRIWLESELGRGSTFAFTLPLRRGHPITPLRTFGPVPTAASASARVVPHGVGSLVLIVEDEQPAGDLLAHYLREAGHRVARARTGAEAMTLARELKPDAITLDILLPGGDGHEVLARLKAAPETRDIPVVVVSITENQDLGLSLGAADWFVKPAPRDDFVSAIRRAVGDVPRSSTATVLVVDDEPATLEFLTDVLAVQGFRVLTAPDGRQGIALALAHQPDVVVLDLVMPDVSGFDVAHELSRHAETRSIPILVFTVKDLTADERERLKGVKAIIMKDQGREHLLQEVARVTAKVGLDG